MFGFLAAVLQATGLFLFGKKKATEEAQDEIIKAQEIAGIEKDKLNAQAEAAYGQLINTTGRVRPRNVEVYDTYDEWYAAQEQEWIAAGRPGTLDEYVRSQQLTELGQYGVQRAQLESSEKAARQQLDLARERVAFEYQEELGKYGEAEVAAFREFRGERYAAAATGFRAGTPQATVAENQRVRQAGLDAYMRAIEFARTSSLTGIATQEQQINENVQINTAALNNALASARTQYSLGIEGINTQTSQFETDVRDTLKEATDFGAYLKSVGGYLFNAASTGLSLYTGAVNAGLVIPNISGASSGGFNPGTIGGSAGGVLSLTAR